MGFIDRFSAQQRIQWLALLAALAGVVFWSSLLLVPVSSPVAAPMQQVVPRTENPAMQWFSNQPLQADIKVSAVMAGGRGAVAILILDDAPPRSFMVGEQIAPGVRLAEINADSVVIEQGNQQSRLMIKKLPEMPALPILTRQ
ncbi:type II secretion system protein N [Pseudomonas sp. NPDC089734]|uniref:type II secretion system protein N n=1 Tax=Pseudomonas sp. NPDC089734 TaxID=3364469 RepID=UPI003830191E